MRSAKSIQRIAIIGFGEVGGIFGNDLAGQGINVSVFDILLKSKRHRKQMLAKASVCRVRAAESLQYCIRESELVISAVTASSSLGVAKQAGPILHRGQVFLDINSVSPETKRKAAACVEKRGADFVEAAVMAPVPGQRLRVPMLLGGRQAAKTAERLRDLGMNAVPLGDQIGVASAVKMCRSVIIKGLEALAVECFFAARQYGAENKVLQSLAATYPGMGWEDRLPDYLISRVAEHGRRRAAEMREVAEALREVGIEPTMALATATRQDHLIRAMAKRKITFEDARRFRWKPFVDAMLG